jgi:ubiquinone/menaquinone biosynthesis C-methylase UbiE
MGRGAATAFGDVGRHLPAFSSSLRPDALRELQEWGGKRLVRGKRVLDLGCGDGRVALAISSLVSSVDGVDPDPEAIAAARRTARKDQVRNARFAVGAAQKLRYPDRSFDVVILSWTL